MNPTIISKYFEKFLSFIPSGLETFDTSRVIILQFSLSGLDILNALPSLSDERKKEIIEWIYNLQIINPNSQEFSGFRGGFFPQELSSSNERFMSCHVTMTYSCLCCLLILGDDLSRVDKKGITKSFVKLQSSEDGCISAALDCPESDVRFIFSAVASSYILNDFSGINVESIVEFILRCQNYDGGFGQRPELESHGGSTYCSLASLKLLGRLESVFSDNSERKDILLRWLVNRQNNGFHGRPNKPDDSCYTFWIGASLEMLNCGSLVDIPSLMNFIETTFDNNLGGFCKYKPTKHTFADPMHTYLCLAGLSTLMSKKQESTIRDLTPACQLLIKQLGDIDPSINISVKKAASISNDRSPIIELSNLGL